LRRFAPQVCFVLDPHGNAARRGPWTGAQRSMMQDGREPLQS
jgi:hypothetical protein